MITFLSVSRQLYDEDLNLQVMNMPPSNIIIMLFRVGYWHVKANTPFSDVRNTISVVITHADFDVRLVTDGKRRP